MRKMVYGLMKKEKMRTDKNIPDLLAKAMTGALTGEERRLLDDWRERDEDNARLCDEVLSPEFMERKCREAAEVDVARGYARVVEKYRRRRFVRRLRRWSAVAAGILLPVAVVLLWPEGREWETARETPVATVIKPGGVKAELVLADGSVRRLRKEDRDSLLAVEEGSIRLREESVSYEGRQAPAEARHNTLRVPRGGEYAVTLSDGTEVRLNSESELRYPVAFGDGERRVYLKGEGYFCVARDEARPFLVEAGGAAVRVLGTSFNLSAYADEGRVAATLVEGSVRFAAGGRSVVLSPGEQGVLTADGRVETREVDTVLCTAWTRGVFAFRQERLEDIMRTVSRWYDVEVFWENPSLKEVTFSGRMRRYDDFSRVVEILEMTGNVRFDICGSAIFIRGK